MGWSVDDDGEESGSDPEQMKEGFRIQAWA